MACSVQHALPVAGSGTFVAIGLQCQLTEAMRRDSMKKLLVHKIDEGPHDAGCDDNAAV